MADRLVLPGLPRTQLEAIAAAEDSLDRITRIFVRNELAFRFAQLPSFAESFELERRVQRGEFPAPVRIGVRYSAWVEAEISEWIEMQVVRARCTESR